MSTRLLAVLALSCLSTPGAAQNYKLSEAPHELTGALGQAVTAGSRTVFRSADGTLGPYMLWSVPNDGSAVPTELHGPNVLGSLQDFRVSPDGETVLYTVGLGGLRGLRVVPVDGSEPSRVVTGAMVGGTGVTSYVISPDSRRAVYVAQHENWRFELYSRPLDLSSPSVRISGDFTPTSGGTILNYRLPHLSDQRPARVPSRPGD